MMGRVLSNFSSFVLLSIELHILTSALEAQQ